MPVLLQNRFSRFTRSVAFHLNMSCESVAALLKLEQLAKRRGYGTFMSKPSTARYLYNRGLIEAASRKDCAGNWELTIAGRLLCALLKEAGFTPEKSRKRNVIDPSLANQFARFTRSIAFTLSMSQEGIDALLTLELSSVSRGRGYGDRIGRVKYLLSRGLIEPATKTDAPGNWQLSKAGRLLCPLLREAGFQLTPGPAGGRGGLALLFP